MSIRSARRQGDALGETLASAKPPVDVERIAKKLSLRVVFLDFGGDVSGLLIAKADSTVIAVQEGDTPKRQRFTIAHEIGHFCLRHQFEPGQHVHVDRGHLITRAIRGRAKGWTSRKLRLTNLGPAS